MSKAEGFSLRRRMLWVWPLYERYSVLRIDPDLISAGLPLTLCVPALTAILGVSGAAKGINILLPLRNTATVQHLTELELIKPVAILTGVSLTS